MLNKKKQSSKSNYKDLNLSYRICLSHFPMLLAFLEDTNIISGCILLTIMLLHDKNCKRAHARAIRRWRNETCDENRVQELFKDQLTGNWSVHVTEQKFLWFFCVVFSNFL